MAEPLWTIDEISAALQVAPTTSHPPVTGVSIDSRTLSPNDLFVAIKGPNTDGHEYVDAAFERGAAAAVVARDFAPNARNVVLYRVPDPLEAMNTLGRAARARTAARVVAVTGSVGKTGTKEMLRSMLSATGETHASEKSYNNLWGVPLSLARMPRGASFGVFEIGMNHAGEITPLTRLVRPHVAIVTWVAAVHIEFFNSVAEIADAKAEIFEGLETGGAAIIPVDNDHFERLAAHARRGGARLVTFGEGANAAAHLTDFASVANGSRVTADILGERLEFTLGVPGRHLAGNAVAALAAAKLLGANLEAAAQALSKFESPEGRGKRATISTPAGEILVIDESYNANPASMAAALQVLGSTPRTKYGRRIAVLGDMLELGHGSAQFHADLASIVDSNGIDLVFCAGPVMAHLFDRLAPEKRGAWAATSEGLRVPVVDALTGGDVIMIKGSLGSKMGPLAEALRLKAAALAGHKQGRDAA